MTNKPQALDEQMIEGLFAAIAHGDEDHRAWLHEAIVAFAAGKPVPPPRGQGRTATAHALMAAKVAEMEEVLRNASKALWILVEVAEDTELPGVAETLRERAEEIDAALAPDPTDYSGIIQPSKGMDQ
jgi:hypothetical protein